MSYPLIGLVGRKRVGKDTVASRLVEAHGFRRFAFADLLREAALALDPIVGIDEWVEELDPRNRGHRDIRLSEVVAEYGWEGAKEWPEVRRTLQNYGVAIRRADLDFWIRPVMAAIAAHPGPAVITDVRFPNEARAVEAAGGRLIRITRPGLDESDTHESETALDGYRTVSAITNDGTSIERLFEKCDALINDWLSKSG